MLVKISKTKAYKVEQVQLEKGGTVFLSVRQMYATQKDPEYKPGRNGLMLPLAEEEDTEGRSEATRVLKALKKVLANEEGKKPKLLEAREPKEPKEKKAKKSKGPK